MADEYKFEVYKTTIYHGGEKCGTMYGVGWVCDGIEDGQEANSMSGLAHIIADGQFVEWRRMRRSPMDEVITNSKKEIVYFITEGEDSGTGHLQEGLSKEEFEELVMELSVVYNREH